MNILGLLCALAVACAAVEALVTRALNMPGPVKESDRKIFRVGCGNSNCDIHSIRTYGGSGNLYMFGEYRKYAPNGIDYEDSQFFYESAYGNPGTKRSHSNRKISAKTFEIHVVPVISFQNVNLEVKLNNSIIQITELSAPGVSIQQCGGKNCVRLRSGYLEQGVPYFEQVKVTCNGNCKNVIFEITRDETTNANLAASTEGLALIFTNGCYSNCFCTSNLPAKHDVCKHGGSQSFNLSSNVVYISLIPDLSLKDVEAFFKADNIVSKEEIIPYEIRSPDGSYVALGQTPLDVGEHAHFAVGCKLGSGCSNIAIEVLEAYGYGFFDIHAGRNTQLTDGSCTTCYCNDITSCRSQFDAPVPTFYITLTTRFFYYHDYVYVKVSGSGIEYFHYTGDKHDPYAPYWG